MNKKYFGTDGIRGTAFDKLNNKLAFSVGQALAKKFMIKEMVIGQDTRLSSDMLAYGIAFGAALAGVNVKIARVVSTPMVAYYSKVNQIIGIMVTASHNPYTDNGIKIFKSGYKMLDEEELSLEPLIDSDDVLVADVFGVISVTNEVETLYSTVYQDLNIPRSNLKIAYDSANGATYMIAKKIIEDVSSQTYQIGNQPDGLNINLNVGSTHLDSIINTVLSTKAEIGLSFDGDGDRLLVVDQDANIFDGDMIVYIIAKYLKSMNKLNKDTVVLTQMSNPGVLKAFKDLGIKVIQTAVGDKYVSDEIVKNNLTIGGENSGHIILNDLLPSGDGLFAGMYLVKVLAEHQTSLKAYTKEVIMYPQKLVNIKNVDKNVLNHPDVLSLIAKVKKDLGEDALLLVRPSGTEPVIRVTISCKDELKLDTHMNQLVHLIKQLGALK